MNNLLQELAGGDLRSDGKANMVAEQVMKNPYLLGMLVEGLSEPDDVIRARTAHALERISCHNPEMLQGLTSQFINRASTDTVPMVKWHLAMLFQNIPLEEQETDAVVSTLFHLLEDKSVFVRSWSIVSLCVIGAKTATKRTKIMSRILAKPHEPPTTSAILRPNFRPLALRAIATINGYDAAEQKPHIIKAKQASLKVIITR